MFTVPPCVAKDQEETVSDVKSDFTWQDSSCLAEGVPAVAGGLKRGGLYGPFQPKAFRASVTRPGGLGGRAALPWGAAPAAGGGGRAGGMWWLR